MIGLVIVTHGRLAKELRLAAEHVVGPMAQMETVCIGPDDDLEQARDGIRAAIKSVDTGRGVVLLTDMFGGTPSNLAISLLEQENIEVVAGANLPMMIKLYEARETESPAEAARTAKKAGRRYIAIASEIIAGEVED
ncbi:MAG TPA: PTS sugar transporter subunit IIA [Hellea balneolensis]|uniref:PTS sugar transporter subunit IIA n=1 Tax=Hellea balneolensis TaxID=287478 RepID=A0A7C5M131_9PROT|nr:PTS sugar transporter subunit IIA [Hellea balneolensis]